MIFLNLYMISCFRTGAFPLRLYVLKDSGYNNNETKVPCYKSCFYNYFYNFFSYIFIFATLNKVEGVHVAIVLFSLGFVD